MTNEEQKAAFDECARLCAEYEKRYVLAKAAGQLDHARDMLTMCQGFAFATISIVAAILNVERRMQ